MLFKLRQFQDMYFQLICVETVSDILSYMEAGVILLVLTKQDKIQNPNVYALLQLLIAFTFFYLVRKHFSKIKQGTLRPQRKRTDLDLNINLCTVI